MQRLLWLILQVKPLLAESGSQREVTWQTQQHANRLARRNVNRNVFGVGICVSEVLIGARRSGENANLYAAAPMTRFSRAASTTGAVIRRKSLIRSTRTIW